VHGRLVEPFRADVLADALSNYLADPGLRAHHGTAGRRRVLTRFRREKVWAEHAAYYQSVGQAVHTRPAADTRGIPLTCTGRS
jgi:hypothetical protein